MSLAIHPEPIPAGTRIGQCGRRCYEFIPGRWWSARIESRFFEMVDPIVQSIGARIERETENPALSIGSRLQGDWDE